MAGTIVYTTPIRRVSRRLVKRAGTFQFDSSYPSGGEPFDPVVGKSLVSIQLEPVGGRVFAYDRANKKILAYDALRLEHNATPSAQTVVVKADDSGLESNFGATRNLQLSEVLNGTDLSAVVVRWEATATK